MSINRFITIICEVPQNYARVERVTIERRDDGELCVPENARICGVFQDDMIERIKDRLWEWCGKTGWLDHDQYFGLPVLRMIQMMESIHCTERSYVDLQASGGIYPESYAEANERFRGAAHRIAGDLEQMAVELRSITTPTREG